jgi:uroporphyrinogen III methyltransferase/synthase
LKNGDPYVFGRGAEEAASLAEQNIPFEVVSGVSSAVAVPASAGVPLTHRDYASSVAIITGHRRDDEEVKIANADTLVFLMPVANLQRIAERLLKDGRSPETPCALIERGTLPHQKVVQGNLASIFKDSKAQEIKAPAVFVVGEVVNLRKSLLPS